MKKKRWQFVADGEETIALKSYRYDNACKEVLRIKKSRVYQVAGTDEWRIQIEDCSLPLSGDSELECTEEGMADYLYGDVIEVIE